MDAIKGTMDPTTTTATHPPSPIERRRLTRHRRFEMLDEIFWRYFIPRQVDDEGSCVPSTRSCRETVPLDSPFSLQSVVKPHLRRGRDVRWESLTQVRRSSTPFFIHEPSWRPSRNLSGVSETQSPLGIPTPREQFSGRGESTVVVIAEDNGDDRSVLKFWDDDWK